MTPASRHQHDTLDQIIAKALREWLQTSKVATLGAEASMAVAVRDALLAEGKLQRMTSGRLYPYEGGYSGDPVLLIPLPGVGCGNAKKDTP